MNKQLSNRINYCKHPLTLLQMVLGAWHDTNFMRNHLLPSDAKSPHCATWDKAGHSGQECNEMVFGHWRHNLVQWQKGFWGHEHWPLTKLGVAVWAFLWHSLSHSREAVEYNRPSKTSQTSVGQTEWQGNNRRLNDRGNLGATVEGFLRSWASTCHEVESSGADVKDQPNIGELSQQWHKTQWKPKPVQLEGLWVCWQIPTSQHVGWSWPWSLSQRRAAKKHLGTCTAEAQMAAGT